MPEPDLFSPPAVSGASYSEPSYQHGDGHHGDPWDNLRDYQQECLQDIDSALERGVTRQLVVMATGLGKMEHTYTPILTPHGWKEMGAIRPGDFVIAKSGKPTMVTGVFPQGKMLLYSVKFNDDTEVLAGAEHLWSVHTKFQKYDAKNGHGTPNRTIDTMGLIRSGLKSNNGETKWFLPIVAPVQFETRLVPVDPYVLGILIGDGSISHGQAIWVKNDQFIVQEVRRRISGEVYSRWVGHHTVNTIRDPAVRAGLVQVGLMGKRSWEKFIPDVYKYNSVDVRLNLLRGLMDTDGTCQGSAAQGAHVEFDTSSVRLADDVIDLVRSFGGVTKKRIRKNPKYTYKGETLTGRTNYRVTVTLNGINPFLLPRKADLVNLSKIQGQTKSIVSIEEADEMDAQCIAVADPEHLYVTVGHTLTHNSYQLSRINRHLNLGKQLTIVHGVDLIEQITSEFRKANRDKKVQMEMGSWRADLDSDIVVASVDTLGRAAGRSPALLKRFPPDHFGIVHCDEVHHAHARTYLNVLRHFKDAKLHIGWTATPFRGDGKLLSQIYDEVVCERSLWWAQEHNHLCDAHAERIRTTADLRDMHTRGMDFDPRDLAAAINTDWVNSEIISGIEDHALSGKKHKPRKAIIIFCTDKDQAEALAAQLRKKGHLAQEILDHTPREKRGEYLSAFREGNLRFLTTCHALGEGVDLPITDCIVHASPTRSLLRYLQRNGRGLRNHPSKDGDYCLILDFAGVCGTMRPITATEAFGVRDIDCLGENVFEVAKLAKEAAEAGAHVQDGDTVEDVKLKIEEIERISMDTVKVDTYAEATALFGHMSLDEEVLRGSCFPWVRVSGQSYTLRAWKAYADLNQNALGQWKMKIQGKTHDIGVTARPLREADRIVKRQVAEWRRFKLDARRNRESATWPQITLLRKLGWEILPAGLTKGAAGVLISQHQIFRRQGKNNAR